MTILGDPRIKPPTAAVNLSSLRLADGLLVQATSGRTQSTEEDPPNAADLRQDESRRTVSNVPCVTSYVVEFSSSCRKWMVSTFRPSLREILIPPDERVAEERPK